MIKHTDGVVEIEEKDFSKEVFDAQTVQDMREAALVLYAGYVVKSRAGARALASLYDVDRARTHLRKVLLQATPQRIPLGPEDVPPGSVFGSPDEPRTHYCACLRVDENGVYIARRGAMGEMITWHSLMCYWSIKRPYCGNWEPCSKLKP